MAATAGILKALSKLTAREVCPCGFTVPKYPGRYPSKCPNCEKPLGQKKDGE